MALVEAFFGHEARHPSFVAEFVFLPRVDESLAPDAGGLFQHYNILEVRRRG